MKFSSDELSLSTLVQGKKLKFDEEVLGKILDVPKAGVRFVMKQHPTVKFMVDDLKVVGTSVAGVIKKFIKFQLVFEFVNKVVLPRSEKRIIDSIVNLFVLEFFSKFELISLPALMIEHMYKVVHVKEGKYDMPYEYFLNKVFDHFGVVDKKETTEVAK